MVKPLHQDFLNDHLELRYSAASLTENIRVEHLDSIPDLGKDYDLFDYFLGWKRKVRLASLDSCIGSPPDWNALLAAIPPSGLLYVVDDRRVAANPIVAKYGKFTKSRYACALLAENVHFIFAACD